ncbi:GNAT family N-acetyltransferase [Nocardioides aurantiacus]|uniref:ElaA protein n=1 Tax=Nocardioides aurantiacus TaxID=86796 RepID=A0A3N2CZM8_9ACTN|nr:GNAT family N-acetyltransferase [Nocardioides aurantiacus]ROR92943.1 ElaA protein [Nocardioides aurantiacus]
MTDTSEQPIWTVVRAADLDVPTLYDVLVLRAEVFVVEQECAYLDPDGLDLLEGTRHLLGHLGEGGERDLVAYARVLAPDAAYDAPRIGRVIVAGRGRGRQLGRALMERALEVCATDHPGLPVELGGQAHLEAFYASLGFEPGEHYVEDGIPHVWMRRPPGRGRP